MKNILTIAAALFVAICMLGCTTMRPLADTTPKAITQALKIGDEVAVKTKDGKSLSFKVEALDEKAISGEGMKVEIKNIQSLKVKKPSPGKTVGLLFGTIGGIALVVFIAFAASIHVN